MRIKQLFTVLFILSAAGLKAADTLTLAKAVEMALRYNLDLQIAGNEAQQAANSNHAGNAGMLPSVSLNVSDQPSLTNLNQKFTNGTVIERNGVFSNALNAGLLFSYTLYDGKRMFAAKRRLEAADQAAGYQLKIRMQQVISGVHRTYGDIIRQQGYLEVLDKLLAFSRKRLELVEIRFGSGLANNTDVYLAKLDIENHRQNLLAQEAKIKNAFTALNMLLNVKADSTYPLMREIPLSPMPAKQALDSMLSRNPDKLLAEEQYKIARETRSEIAAAMMPLIRLNAAYNYSLSQSQAGFSLYNQVSGPQAGISLSVPLYSGNTNRSNLENAGLEMQNSELRTGQTLQLIRGLFEQTWQDYRAALLQLESGSGSVLMASDYIALMQERFRLGQSTILELQEAQRVYEETAYRQLNNRYALRLAETQLLSLSGSLLREER